MDDIEQVLSKIDIVELINTYLPLKKAGRNFKALCPFHSEKTPSFMVSPELQIYKCFGCGAGGNAIKFVSEYEKISFGEALRFLAEKAGVKLSHFRPDKKEVLRERLYQINHLAAEFYHYLLTQLKLGKKALSYLWQRGINNESIKIFKLGFAPAGWENLYRYLVKKKNYREEELVQAGLILKREKFSRVTSLNGRTCYDRFRQRIIFPIFDHRGQIIGFSGRIFEEEIEGAKYINTPETLLYHKSASLYGLYQAKEAIKRAKNVILVEGEFDVISSYQSGIKNVVAIKGSAVTPQQVELLKRFTDNFYFCLDADFAGQEAAKRGIEIAEAAGVNIRAIKLPVGKDPDECVRINPVSWREATRQTLPIYDFYLESAVANFGLKDGESKKLVSEAVLPIFSKIQNEIVKAHYLKKLANFLEVSEESVRREARRQSKLEKSFSYPLKVAGQKEKKSKRELTEEYLLALILQTAEKAGELIKGLSLDFLSTPAVKKIFSYLQAYLEQAPKLDIKSFVKILPEELKETAGQLYLYNKEGLNLTWSLLQKEWQKTLKEIEKLALHGKLKRLREALKEKGSATIEKEIVKLSQRLKELS